MKVAILFNGVGLSMKGFEEAGLECTGFEIDPAKNYLARMLVKGPVIEADVRDVDLRPFDAVWASPPCQLWSGLNHGNRVHDSGGLDDPDLLWWSLNLAKQYPHLEALWVENVFSNEHGNTWGTKYNAAQFLPYPIQKRRRLIGGKYKRPFVYRPFKYDYPEFDICPAITASEYKQGGMTRQRDKERRKASRWYGRSLSLTEMAYHQGLEVPQDLLNNWFYRPPFDNPQKGRPYTFVEWKQVLSQGIGNGVPVYMAKAFALAYTQPDSLKQLNLFEYL